MALVAWQIYTTARNAQERQLSEAAQMLSVLVDNELENVEASLAALATSPALDRADLAAFHAQASQVPVEDNATIVLSDLEGYRLLNTRVPFGAPLPKAVSAVHRYRTAAGPEGPVVTDLFYAPVGRSFDFAVQVPVMRGGKAVYYLAMGLPAASLSRLVQKTHLRKSWRGTVADRNGIIIARSADSALYTGKPIRQGLRSHIANAPPAGLYYGVTLDGQRVVTFYSRCRSGWTVLLSVPRSELRLPAYRATAMAVAVMLAVLGVGMLLARKYSLSITGPISRLRQQADALGAGTAVTPMDSGFVEADLVSRALAGASGQIARHQEDLQRQVSEAVAASERAMVTLMHSQKLEALGRLTAGIAHDFNNVLQTLSSGVQLAQLTRDDARRAQLLVTCQQAIERAAALIGQMRSFGRAQEVNAQLVVARDTLAALLPLLYSSLPREIALQADLDSSAWQVRVDTTQLDMAILNLVINARDAIGAAGIIHLSAGDLAQAVPVEGAERRDWVQLEVRDNGRGMDAATLARAVEPFFSTKPPDRGGGLGLSQAFGFATQAGGHLVLDSTLGRGTSVSLYLPRVEEAGNVGPAGQAFTALAREPNSVLFVEDDELVRETVVAGLRGAGLAVSTAENGDEALAFLRQNGQVEVLFTDIVMPGSIDGVSLAQIVQREFPQVRIIVASGYRKMPIALQGVTLLAKPYDLQAALAAIQQELPPSP
ncbi:hybrid sensor histidine kinase/response regulator [Massilia sp. SM-13]|uniref:hybrid sensor histidine kinase/response regulator n=1 Tax=Pseudoduganella rhizocola TaxID=3382643 RepID=UPI0038B45FA3